MHQQADGDGLNPAGAQAPSHLFPEERREGVAHQAIQDAPRFLGMDKLHVELAGLLQGSPDGFLGDLVEHHPLDRNLRVQELQQVPADGLTFPVFVGREEQLISAFKGVLQFFDRLLLVLRNHVERFEILGRVHAEVRPLLALVGRGDLAGVVGQVAHVPHRGLNLEVLRQEPADGAGLGGAFNDDEGVRHRQAVNRFPLYRTDRQPRRETPKVDASAATVQPNGRVPKQLCSLFWLPPTPLRLRLLQR